MSTADPRVSFLMATNRSGDACRRAIESCLAQSFTDFELVVVANGLGDDEYEILDGYCRQSGRVRLFRTEIKRLTFSLNLGLHEARGEYIARMDDDDISYPERLAEQVRFLDQNADISVCGSWCDLIDESGNVIGEWRYPEQSAMIRRVLRYSNPLCHPAVMFRKKTLASVGGYCGLFAEDYATWALLSADRDIGFANLPIKLLAYRANHASHARNLTWRNAKATLAGTQLQLFGITHHPGWLVGVVLNLIKTFLRGK